MFKCCRGVYFAKSYGNNGSRKKSSSTSGPITKGGGVKAGLLREKDFFEALKSKKKFR